MVIIVHHHITPQTTPPLPFIPENLISSIVTYVM